MICVYSILNIKMLYTQINVDFIILQALVLPSLFSCLLLAINARFYHFLSFPNGYT